MSAESHAIQQAAAEFIRDRHLLGAFVTGLLRDVHAAEDVLQEVWVLLSAELEKGTRIQNQAAWCRGVARNLIRRHWEKRQMAKVVADSEALDAFMDRVEQCFAWAETQEHFATARLAALDECVASLPERSRRLLSLKYAQRAAMERIAEETGQSFEAVKKALIRLRAALLECVRRRLLRKLLNDPPPPAPANVPQLTRLEDKLLTTRERVLMHQEQPQCASCHRRIDPIGFGLENFDAVGQWRTEDSYERAGLGKKTWQIDPAGAFHKGAAFANYSQMRDLIAQRTDDFGRGLSTALVEYALGHPVGFSDEPLIERMVTEAKAQNFTLRTFIHALIQSREFQTK